MAPSERIRPGRTPSSGPNFLLLGGMILLVAAAGVAVVLSQAKEPEPEPPAVEPESPFADMPPEERSKK